MALTPYPQDDPQRLLYKIAQTLSTGSSAPANMLTTDTSQSIGSGVVKTWAGKQVFNGGISVADASYRIYSPGADAVANDATFRAAYAGCSAGMTLLVLPGTVRLQSPLLFNRSVSVVGVGGPNDFRFTGTSGWVEFGSASVPTTYERMRFENAFFGTAVMLVAPVSLCTFRHLSGIASLTNDATGDCGTWEDCAFGVAFILGTVNAGSVFRRCTAGDYSFASASGFYFTEFNGTAIDCTAGTYSFGIDLAGTVTNCTAGDASFGKNAFAGTANNCTAGDNSFGSYGLFAGTATGCTAGVGSFGGLGADGTGTALRCIGGVDSFPVDGGLIIECLMPFGTFVRNGVTGAVVRNCLGASNAYVNAN